MPHGTIRTKKARPALESLEARQLMDAAAGLQAITAADAPVTDFRYTTPRGVRVAVNLEGPGSLAGTSVRPDGALDLVYDNTDATSQIISHATGAAPLASVRDADVALDAQAGSGANLLGLAGLRVFNLVDGGTINLIGGVRKLLLNNVGGDTQVFLRELPEAEAQRQAATGRDLTLEDGGTEIAIVGGNFVPIFGVTGTSEDVANEPPPGIRVQVNRINAAPLPGGTIGDPQVYGYDPVAGTLVRFDAADGAVLQTIAAPSLADTAGLGLGRIGRQNVVLLGQGDVVRVFDAPTGALIGQFSTSNLPGFDSIDGIGTTDLRTFLVDAKADGPGFARGVNVAASLASGVAVPTTASFAPSREFAFFGGATGVAGIDLLTVLGSGFFDTFQPTTPILGAMELDTTRGRIAENSRFAAPGNQDAPPPGTDEALGSVDQLIARVVGVDDGANLVNLLRRDNVTVVDTLRLQYPNRLAGLTESFRPNLRGSAVFDVQGDLQAFLANDARGLVLNDLGTLNLLGIGRARDSFVAGFPVRHVFLGARRNVQIVSPAPRAVDGRGGVTVVPGLRPIGPLSIS